MALSSTQAGPKASGGGGGLVQANVQDVTLTADDMITSPVATPQEGELLAVLIEQDGTGGWQITWDTVFHLVGVDIAMAPGALSLFFFVARADNEWYLFSSNLQA